jgi:ammonium transporter, Amt family
LLLLLLSPALASNVDPVTAEQALFWVNNIWILMAAFLVFIMHLGFAMLEAGMSRAKNTVNILFKNICVLSIGLLTYAAVGFSLMYPGESFAGGWFGFAGFGLSTDASGLTIEYADGSYTYWTDFIFQAMFAATAATIVSGAVAERVKLASFLIFSSIYVAIVYPMIGMWHWGGGWLSVIHFHDFAGSTLVHTVGGWAALIGAWYLGPRLGRYGRNGEAVELKPHSMPLAAIGAFLLWFGWYGFNGGSVLSANPAAVSIVVVTTTLAAATGVLAAAILDWTTSGKPNLGMALNGALAGLVGITAGADVVTPMQAIIIGGTAGVLVTGATELMNRMRIDDPVGAVPVHLVCGIWGTLAVGLFVPEVSFAVQLIGIAATAAICVPATLVIFGALDAVLGMRVSAEEEHAGLDLEEHGHEAYAGFPTLHSPISLPIAAK